MLNHTILENKKTVNNLEAKHKESLNALQAKLNEKDAFCNRVASLAFLGGFLASFILPRSCDCVNQESTEL
ncbi:hypothetical protein K9K77_02580 [Candidatus Babeliales bacterium]|nr:hypothetical protein [Candidatus Babeliales bacterium]